MKRMFCVLLAVVCVCIFAACGETEDEREGGGLLDDVLIEQIQRKRIFTLSSTSFLNCSLSKVTFVFFAIIVSPIPSRLLL